MSGTTQPAWQRHDFTGKVAIVTGAAQGIGEAYARALAAAGPPWWSRTSAPTPGRRSPSRSGPTAAGPRSPAPTSATRMPRWPWILEHVRALGEKDLSLALDLGAELGVDLPMARLALGSFAAGLGLGSRGEEPGR